MIENVKVKKPRNGSTVEPASDDPVDQRLARIQGQVVGIRKMRKENRNCVDVITQMSAILAALEQVRVEFLTHHMNDCTRGEGCLPSKVLEAMDDEDRRAENRAALDRFVK